MPGPTRGRKGPTPRKTQEKAVLLYHEMRRDEDFEFTAEVLFRIVRDAATKFPGKPRHLVLSIEGHLNEEKGLDHDAWELVSNFLPGMLGPYLTEIKHPLGHFNMNHIQSEDVPHSIVIRSGEGDEREKTIAAMTAHGLDVYDADVFADGFRKASDDAID